MAFVTRKEYCELKGWSRQYVGKLVKSQRLVLNAAEQIDGCECQRAASGHDERPEQGRRSAWLTKELPESFPAFPLHQTTCPEFRESKSP
ncbi:hypothetical protein C7534_102361 [Pseudomonas sp. OV226]|nr:hypothetical protein C7534_102361 [Pseudomonas sp. OV226]